ncbi:hypothetical protein TcCL_Unassigned02427, partial [Trypanosoma cruzi]
RNKRVGAWRDFTKVKKLMNIVGQDFYYVCHAAKDDRVFVYAYSLHQKKKKLEQKKKIALLHQPTQHPSYSMRHPACSATPRFVQSAGRAAATPAPRVGIKRETKVRNTSLITDCSKRPLKIRKNTAVLIIPIEHQPQKGK